VEVAGGVAIVDPVSIVLKPNLRIETVDIFSIQHTHSLDAASRIQLRRES
jgi:hypothetical protein